MKIFGFIAGCTVIGLTLSPSQSAKAAVFDLTKSTPTSGSTLSYSVNGANLTFQNPDGANTPVVQANNNGVCANMTFNNNLATGTVFCGQNTTNSVLNGQAANQTLTSIKFQFDKDQTLTSFTVAAADFQNPVFGSPPAVPPAGQVGTGIVTFKAEFNNADSGQFISPDIVMRVDPNPTFTNATFTNSNAGFSCLPNGGARCRIAFASGYAVKAGTLVTITTPSFTGSSTNGYGQLNSPGAHWRLAQLETFEAPGPLPVMGGAAAFGWSRRLRKRIVLAKKSAANSTV